MSAINIFGVALLAFLEAAKAEGGVQFDHLSKVVALISIDAEQGIGFIESENSKKLATAVQALQSDFVESGQNIPESYAKSLDYDAELLKQARRENSKFKANQLAVDVLDDLNLKGNFANRGLGVNASFGSPLVEIVVSTIHTGSEVKGYDIYCNPRRYAENDVPMFPLATPSSPTKGEVPPGIYLCFATKGGHLAGSHTVRAGLSGAESQPVVIEVE